MLRLPAAGEKSDELEITLYGRGATVVQIYVFGNESEEYNAEVKSAPVCSVADSVAVESVTGIPRTAFTDLEGYFWAERTGKASGKKAMFSLKETYGKLTYEPILPKESETDPTVTATLLRGDAARFCFALTSTDAFKQTDVRVETECDDGLECKVYVMGAIDSRSNGVNLGPMFDGENGISDEQTLKLIKNGAEIKDFPVIHLHPLGSELLFVKLRSTGKAFGTRRARITAGGATVTIIADIWDISLPEVDVRVGGYSQCTEMRPFRYADRYEREVEYLNELGINVFSADFDKFGDFEKAVLKGLNHPIFSVWVFGRYGHDLYNATIAKASDVTPEVREFITEEVRRAVKKAAELGIGYDGWEVQNADEPGLKNMEAFAEMCRVVKQADPNVNIYANPSFWRGWDRGLNEPDDKTAAALAGWYDEYVDCSCPHMLNLIDHPKTYARYTADRKYNCYYDIIGQHMKSERKEMLALMRDLAWKALDHGFNGWSFYAYYRPIGDPWNDSDGYAPDYLVVYPGEYGPIPTRASEAFGEGYADYRIMKLLSGVDRAAYRRIMTAYRRGNADFAKLKQRAVNALIAKYNGKEKRS